MSPKEYAQCPRKSPFSCMVDGKGAFGGHCECKLAIKADGTFMGNTLETHKCDLVWGQRIWAEYLRLTPEEQAEYRTVNGIVIFEDKQILRFANAIEETIRCEQKIAVAYKCKRVEGGTCPKAALLTLAGLIGIKVANRQPDIDNAINALIEGNSRFFGSSAMVSKEEAASLFSMFSDWVGHMQGTVDSHGVQLCVQSVQIAGLRNDVDGLLADRNAAIVELEDLKARLAALEVHIGAPAHVPAPPVVIVIDDDE